MWIRKCLEAIAIAIAEFDAPEQVDFIALGVAGEAGIGVRF
jgi:hypothetical protein